jgi:trigger factor
MELIIKNIFDKKLKKEYLITLPKDLIETKISENIAKIKTNFSLKGFRKGHVPNEIIDQKYGQSIMADEVDKIISKTVQNIVKENNFKPAMQPKIDIKNFERFKDIEISLSIELYPEVPDIELKKVKAVKREVEIDKSDIEEAQEKLFKNYRKFIDQEESYKAKKGDAVNIDYVGSIDKKEFEGGSAKGYQLELGSKSFIDDFEDQLINKKAGDQVKVKVKFPKDYHNAEFSGKNAEFDVKINKVLIAENQKIDDEFIKNTFGIESQEKLKEELKKQIEENYRQISKNLFKKEFFDYVNTKYDFALPEGLVEEQLKDLMKENDAELKANPDKIKNEKEEKKDREKKKEIAERMIRCGMILNDIAIKNKVEVSNEDIDKELRKILTRFPGQEKIVIDFYQKNPQAISQLKGSIIEEKTIDFILSVESIEKKKTSTKDIDKLWKKANEE